MSYSARDAAELRKRVIALAEPEVELLGCELFDLEILRGGGRLTLRFSIDKEGGVSIQDCAEADRAISRILETEEDLITGRYVVEVSSPGVFRSLKRPDHFTRFVGEIVKATVETEAGEAIQLRGRLGSADAEKIVLVDDAGAEHSLTHERIRKAHLDPDLEFGARSERKSKRSDRRGRRKKGSARRAGKGQE